MIYKIKTNGYKAVIMDYENSFLINKLNTNNNNDFLQRDIIRFITDMILNSKKITFDNKYLVDIINNVNDTNEILKIIDKIELNKYVSLEELLKKRQIEYMFS